MEPRPRALAVLRERARSFTAECTRPQSKAHSEVSEDLGRVRIPTTLIDRAKLSVLAGEKHVFVNMFEIMDDRQHVSPRGSLSLYVSTKVEALNDLRAGERVSKRMTSVEGIKLADPVLMIGEILREAGLERRRQAELVKELESSSMEDGFAGAVVENVVVESKLQMLSAKATLEKYDSLFHT